MFLICETETPPRTWGRLGDFPPAPDPRRNTPTHVGKTTNRQSAIADDWPPPHARGEDVQDAGTSQPRPTMETPPRTWGRRLHPVGERRTERNTPTHVGKTRASRPPPSTAWKHPHARGEDYLYRAWQTWNKETPPRTWGRPEMTFSHFGRLRNTPTHVGKTYWCIG